VQQLASYSLLATPGYFQRAADVRQAEEVALNPFINRS